MSGEGVESLGELIEGQFPTPKPRHDSRRPNLARDIDISLVVADLPDQPATPTPEETP